MRTDTRRAGDDGSLHHGRLALVLLVCVASAAVVASSRPAGATAPAASHPSLITVQCPSAACPYTPPTSAEAGAATDILARFNIERADPQRDYYLNGVLTTLPPYTVASGAEQTAQAAAEYDAANGLYDDYGGPQPPGYSYDSANGAGYAQSSAAEENGLMTSYGHALGVLSAAPTEAAVGAACDAAGNLHVVWIGYNADQPSWQAGQTRFQQELAENNVYTQSGGTITTVTDSEGTGPAQDYLPQQPIAAGTQRALYHRRQLDVHGPQYQGRSRPPPHHCPPR